MKTTVQCDIRCDMSVIWVDTDIRLLVETTSHSVIWADAAVRLTVKTTAQSVNMIRYEMQNVYNGYIW